ncbi:hypothetical protein TOPH_08234, partial [Tolypocladium ophioglossoides CBS 100239]
LSEERTTPLLRKKGDRYLGFFITTLERYGAGDVKSSQCAFTQSGEFSEMHLEILCRWHASTSVVSKSAFRSPICNISAVSIRLTWRLCDVNPISLGTITTYFVIVRMDLRNLQRGRALSPDDEVILSTLILRISCTTIDVWGLIAHGFGRNVWDDATGRAYNIRNLVKLSLSLFYLYIFPGAIIRQFLWGTALLNIFSVSFSTVVIFPCSPISY